MLEHSTESVGCVLLIVDLLDIGEVIDVEDEEVHVCGAGSYEEVLGLREEKDSLLPDIGHRYQVLADEAEPARKLT